jgi:hypothetical protein
MQALPSDQDRIGSRPRVGRGRLHEVARDRAGLTIVEMVIGIFLAIIVVIGAGSVYLGTLKSFKVGSAKLRAQQEATILTTAINRRIRVGSGFGIYNVPNRSVPADSGNGLTIRNATGAVINRIEWSPSSTTLVDSLGNRLTAMNLQNLKFLKDPAAAKTVRYRFKVDDQKGNFIDIQSAASVRN